MSQMLSFVCVCGWQGNKRGKKASDCDLWGGARRWNASTGTNTWRTRCWLSVLPCLLAILFLREDEDEEKCFHFICVIVSALCMPTLNTINQDISWPRFPTCWFLFNMVFNNALSFWVLCSDGGVLSRAALYQQTWRFCIPMTSLVYVLFSLSHCASTLNYFNGEVCVCIMFLNRNVLKSLQPNVITANNVIIVQLI